ncbi:hypothetical protein BC831DRAFT_514053 [Entophlyctis helioformis]|nr:hypothetical protein BC831DRAFT_514053 [Entophlyctis helioformis]
MAQRGSFKLLMDALAPSVVGMPMWASPDNVRVAVASMGGKARLLQAFSGSQSVLISTLKSLDAAMASKYSSSISTSNMTASDFMSQSLQSGLEALRVFAPNTTSACPSSEGCSLGWRPDSSKFIVMATNSDSDLPYMPANRMTGQSQGHPFKPFNVSSLAQVPAPALLEPAFLPSTWWYDTGIAGFQMYRNASAPPRLSSAWQAEVNATAQSLLSSRTHLVLFADIIAQPRGSPMSSWDYPNPYREFALASVRGTAALETDTLTTAAMQYGHPLYNVFVSSSDIDPLALDRSATLDSLRSNGLPLSLQSLMLAGNGQMEIVALDQLQTLVGDRRNDKGIFSFVVTSAH